MSAADNDGDTGNRQRRHLLAAREVGFLGPGPIERHLLHAQGFVDLAKNQAEDTEDPRILDLGPAGGSRALSWPKNGRKRRSYCWTPISAAPTSFKGQVISCGLQGRVRVVQQRAEVGGRDPQLRGSFDGVVVRSFGPPAVVAECAAPFLREGGWLIVSEPPVENDSLSDESRRWPAESLTEVGLTPSNLFGGSSAIKCCANPNSAG